MGFYPARSLVGRDPDTVGMILRMQKARMERAIQNRHEVLTDAGVAACLEAAREEADLILTRDQLLTILDLYPIERGEIATVGIDAATDVREMLFRVLADFFLGCDDWPTYGDGVDVTEFVAVLKRQATVMGYEVVPDEPPQNAGP